jgi:hypothetical protein
MDFDPIAAPKKGGTEDDEEGPDVSGDEDDEDEPTNVWFAVDEAVDVFVCLRWPEDVARNAIEYICTKLMRSGNRKTAFEALRRDRHAHALLDVDQRAWLVFLRVILGNQHPDLLHTSAGRGMLLRLVIGDTPEDLLADTALLAEIASIRQPVRGPDRKRSPCLSRTATSNWSAESTPSSSASGTASTPRRASSP